MTHFSFILWMQQQFLVYSKVLYNNCLCLQASGPCNEHIQLVVASSAATVTNPLSPGSRSLCHIVAIKRAILKRHYCIGCENYARPAVMLVLTHNLCQGSEASELARDQMTGKPLDDRTEWSICLRAGRQGVSITQCSDELPQTSETRYGHQARLSVALPITASID